MPCQLEQSTASELWLPLLEFRRAIAERSLERSDCVAFVRRQGCWSFLPRVDDLANDPGSGCLLVPLTPAAARALRLPGGVPACAFSTHPLPGDAEPFLPGPAGPLDRSVLTFFSLYLPILLGGLSAAREGRSFVTAHLAQTLDGRIACRNGHSQWISNQANRVHSHRLRALHDAVLVGGRTVERDDPLLTVRHVAGDNPVRIILNASGSLLRSDGSAQIFRGDDSLLICGSDRAGGAAQDPIWVRAAAGLRIIPLDHQAGRLIPPAAILTALVGCGLSSVFLEGGAETLSQFLEPGALDLLHLHVSPMILGSGINSFSLTEATTVQQGRRFHVSQFDLDGELLLVCRERRAESDDGVEGGQHEP